MNEWRLIVADRDRLDYRMARWSHAARAEFSLGPDGDRIFLRWLSTELGLALAERTQILRLARSFAVVDDEDVWLSQGPVQLGKLVDLPPRERVAVLREAKAQGRSIGAVLRMRQVAAERLASTTLSVGSAHQRDVKMLARFARGLDDEALASMASDAVTKQRLDAPADVRAAIQRLRTLGRRRVA